jgi:hypothetical protein
MGIGCGAGIVSAATAKHLALGQELSVYLQPDDSLVFHLPFSLAHFQIVYQREQLVASGTVRLKAHPLPLLPVDINVFNNAQRLPTIVT